MYSHPLRILGGELLVPRRDDPVPQVLGDVGAVLGARDAGHVQRGEVGQSEGQPVLGLQVHKDDLLLGQNDQGVGVVVLWKVRENSLNISERLW